MSGDERHEIAERFVEDFRDLVHKHAGKIYDEADTELLIMMQERTSVFNPYVWSEELV